MLQEKTSAQGACRSLRALTLWRMCLSWMYLSDSIACRSSENFQKHEIQGCVLHFRTLGLRVHHQKNARYVSTTSVRVHLSNWNPCLDPCTLNTLSTQRSILTNFLRPISGTLSRIHGSHLRKPPEYLLFRDPGTPHGTRQSHSLQLQSLHLKWFGSLDGFPNNSSPK